MKRLLGHGQGGHGQGGHGHGQDTAVRSEAIADELRNASQCFADSVFLAYMTHSVFIMFMRMFIMPIIMFIIMSIIMFIINLYLCFVFLSLSIFFSGSERGG